MLFMAEGTTERLVGAVLLFHGCEVLRSARIAVEHFHFILGRICLRAKNNPQPTTNFLERLPDPCQPSPASFRVYRLTRPFTRKTVIPCGAGNLSSIRPYLCL